MWSLKLALENGFFFVGLLFLNVSLVCGRLVEIMAVRLSFVCHYLHSLRSHSFQERNHSTSLCEVHANRDEEKRLYLLNESLP